MEKPMVSVICITYNHEKYIANALDGFLMQKTSFPFEIIVIDDASTDRNPEIIREYMNRHPEKVKGILLEENYYSQNKPKLPILQENAGGKYVALCEGDDYWIDEYKLQKQFDFMESNPEFSWCVHNGIFKDLQNNTERDYTVSEHSREFSAEEVILGGGGFCPTASIFTYSKFYFDRPSYFKIMSMDIVLQAHLASLGKTYCFADKMSVYRYNVSGSWTERMHEGNKDQVVERRKKHADKLQRFWNEYNIYTNGKYDSAIKKNLLRIQLGLDIAKSNVSALLSGKYMFFYKKNGFKWTMRIILSAIKNKILNKQH